MYNALWLSAILVHILLLVVLLRSGIYQRMWWFMGAVVFDLAASPVLTAIMIQFGRNSKPYFMAYYAANLFIIFVWLMASYKCVTSGNHWIGAIGLINGVYELGDVSGILVLHYQSRDLANAAQITLHIYNLMTLVVTLAILILYSKSDSNSGKGDKMSTEATKAEEIDEPIEPVEDEPAPDGGPNNPPPGGH
jgi:hypothetical protein